MRATRWIGMRLRAILRRAKVERELDEELREHLERDVAERVRRGADPAAARRAAGLTFGGVERWKEECREARGIRLLDELAQDVRFGLRSLRRNPTFTMVVVGILGLGIGLLAALAAAFHGVLIRPLPYRHEDRVVVLWQTSAADPSLRDDFAPGNFLDLQGRLRSFDALAAAMEWGLDAMEPEGPVSLRSWRVSPGFFELLGSEPLLGRTFLPGEHIPGRDHVTVLAHRYWQRRFGGDPGVIGRVLTLDGEPYEVVGVMPPGFVFTAEKELWTPGDFAADDREERFATYLNAIGRLAPGVGPERAQRELDTLAARLAVEHPRSNTGVGFAAVPLREQVVGDVRPLLWVLLSATVVLLLVACSNIASLYIARTAGRERELGVRVALGAGRARVGRQLLTEAALLAAAGCALGALLGHQAVRLMKALAPADLPRLDEISLGPGVLALTAAASVLTVLAFAALPAARAARLALHPRLGSARATPSTRRPLRKGLVVGQLALSFVLLVGAGLLVRTFVALSRVEPGYSGQRVLATSFFLYGRYDTPPQRLAFIRELTGRLERLPGVRSVGIATALPLMDQIGREDADVRREDQTEEVRVRGAAVTPGYFHTLEIPLLRGRMLGEADDPRGAPVAVVSDALARRFFPGEDPVGRQLLVGFPGGPVPRQIVGVVGDVRHAGLDETPVPTVYVPLLQAPSGALDVVVRTAGDPAALGRAVAGQVWALSPTLPLYATATLDELRGSSLRVRRFVLVLLSAFAASAVLLAALGVFGLLDGAMAERRREIGVRLVVGARARDVLAGVLRESATMALAGLGLGALAAIVGTRVLGSLLYAVTPLDSTTFVAGAAGILMVALLAALGPAWRASAVDPVVTLRE